MVAGAEPRPFGPVITKGVAAAMRRCVADLKTAEPPGHRWPNAVSALARLHRPATANLDWSSRPPLIGPLLTGPLLTGPPLTGPPLD